MDRSVLEAVFRADAMAFVHGALAEIKPGVKFDLSWHHEAIINALREMLEGECQRQIINMPPRQAKSLLVSVIWVAWLLGQNPATQIVVVSYSERLAQDLSNLTRRLMESEFYRRLFPNTMLASATNDRLVTTAGGGRLATTVEGSVTGLGGDWIIIDDPMNASDARSEAGRERVKEYFNGTLLSRLNDPTTGKMVLVMQRLHEDDLAGHLLLEEGDWRHLCLPAEAPEDAEIPIGPGVVHQVRKGDLLHETRLPRSLLAYFQRQMGPQPYAAQYQQSPVPADGTMIKKEWLRFYKKHPPLTEGTVVLSVDTAQKVGAANDYSVCTVWLRTDHGHYVLDLWRDKIDFVALVEKIRALRDRYGATVTLVEEGSNGSPLLDHLKKESQFGALGRRAKGSKAARVDEASPEFANGRVLLPEYAPWLAACLKELLGFPDSSHDDQVDSFTQFLIWAKEPTSGIISTCWGHEPPPPPPEPGSLEELGLPTHDIIGMSYGGRW